MKGRPNVKKNQNREEKIEHSEGKGLLPVSADGINEIRINEHGISLDDVSGNVGRADVDKSEGKEGQKRKGKENIIAKGARAFADLKTVDTDRDQLGGRDGVFCQKNGTERRIDIGGRRDEADVHDVGKPKDEENNGEETKDHNDIERQKLIEIVFV